MYSLSSQAARCLINRSQPICRALSVRTPVRRAPHTRRTMSTSPGASATTPSTPSPPIIFSENSPPDLTDRLSKLSAWSLSPSKMGLVRQFTFPTFSAAWRFMSIVADECKKKKHHPSWHNLYNQVTVEWTTHEPKGLSVLDVEMAEFCDSTANFIGLREQGDEVASTSTEAPKST